MLFREEATGNMSGNEEQPEAERSGLRQYLSPLNVWALSLGCAVGWGAFVMPGTTFLPLAGPIGTAVGMAIGAFIMLVIGFNYHFLMNRYPDAGGTLTYSARVFGYDHGLLSAWFLMLVYIAIMWANATAIVLIVRNLFGDILQIGFHYQVAGYDVYCGEVLLTLAVILLSGATCMTSRHAAIRIQTVMVILLVCGVFLCTFFALRSGIRFKPHFADTGRSPVAQIANIVMLAPWAFVGFESVSHSTEGFAFSPKKTIHILTVALAAGALCYILLAVLAVSVLPEGYADWQDYIHALGDQEGLASFPVFYAAYSLLGQGGLAILGVTITAAIITGLIGNFIGASRLIYAMGRDGILPDWFAWSNEKGNPVNASRFLVAISIIVPFAGRAAIGWIVDVNTIGALIAYAYTSAAAYKAASSENNRFIRATGLAGAVISVLFFLYFMVPNIWTVSSLSTESYLILILWSVLGFVFFRYVFDHDRHERFGRSTAVWIALLFLIFFTSMLWFREATHDMTEQVLDDLNAYHVEELAEHGILIDEGDTAETASFMQQKMDEVNAGMGRNSWLQMLIIIVALLIMLSIYRLMMQRQKQMEIAKVEAEQSNRAKSTFLSNMSHDIRTPMNAIIGYTKLAEKEEDIPPKITEYLTKIEASSQHLLALINDVLDMSRIENGKMELEIAASDLIGALDDVRDLFSTQMKEKGIRYEVIMDGVTSRWVMCDTNRLNRVLLNLISNAYKFTPEGGSVTVTLAQQEETADDAAFTLSVRDTGMGMSPEFAATVFEAYSREKTASNIQGTGLGMAITKSIVDLMGGTIRVQSEQGKGSEFLIALRFPLAEDGSAAAEDVPDTEALQVDFSSRRLLLVDDNMVNREIASLILKDAGFLVDTAADGQEAVDRVAASAPGDYAAVLMDVQMPVMDGYEATKHIRALGNGQLSAIPVIAMTANAFAEDVQAARDAGMDGHIAKPIDIKQMMQTLAEVLREEAAKK